MDIIRRRGDKPAAKHADARVRPTSDAQSPQPTLPKTAPQPVQEIVNTATDGAILPETTQVEDQPPAPIITDVPTQLAIDPSKKIDTPASTESKKPNPKTVTKTVEIKISLPAMPNLKPITEHPAYAAAKLRTQKLPRKKIALGGIILAIVLFTIGGYVLPDSDAKVTADPNTTNPSPDLVLGAPNYAIMLPKGKTLESFKGSTWVNSSDRSPVFVYIDSIGTTTVNISQQPLPDDFKSDPTSKIEQLAVGFKANEKVSAGNSMVYIGTSKEGTQSLVFYKNNLLILMTSKIKIPTEQWIEYINSLR